MAIHRLRLIIATLAALLVPAGLAGPALAAHIRVEGKSHSIFQGNARPFVGTLRGHTTTKQTALGSLVTASRKQPFALRLTWSDCCGGAWNGFFVSSIDHVTPPVTAFWAFKLNQQLAGSGLGSTRVTRDSHVLVYYTTFDPKTGATEPTLGITASTRRPPLNGRVTFTVSSYDDAGTGHARSRRPGAGQRRSPRRGRQRRGDAAVCPRHILGAGGRAGCHPLAEAVGARLIATAALAVIAAGCGQGAASVPPGPAAVQVSVTRDYGSTRLVSARAAPGQSALDALRRSAHVGTSYGGRFVESVNGLSGDRSAANDWLYFVNGIAPDVGAADMRLHPGDREWWDRRYWRDLVQTPVAIGAWPEPFVHGYDGHRHPVSVGGLGCASRIAGALRTDGARVTSGTAPYRVTVATFAQAGQELADWRGKGLTVSLSGGRVMVYRGSDGLQPLPAAHALIAGFQPPGAPGAAVDVVVAGDDQQSACAAAGRLADDPRLVRDTYAVALDADGRLLAAGGRQ